MSLSWKTTLMGLLAIVPQVIAQITPALPQKWAAIATAVATAIGLYFAKDKNVPGTS